MKSAANYRAELPIQHHSCAPASMGGVSIIRRCGEIFKSATKEKGHNQQPAASVSATAQKRREGEREGRKEGGRGGRRIHRPVLVKMSVMGCCFLGMSTYSLGSHTDRRTATFKTTFKMYS